MINYILLPKNMHYNYRLLAFISLVILWMIPFSVNSQRLSKLVDALNVGVELHNITTINLKLPTPVLPVKIGGL